MPEERERARTAEEDRHFDRDEAAQRWMAWIAEPANVDALIALVGSAPAAVPVEDLVAGVKQA
jgi:uncharacterized membrane protein YebE (DUF533 family)